MEGEYHFLGNAVVAAVESIVGLVCGAAFGCIATMVAGGGFNATCYNLSEFCYGRTPTLEGTIKAFEHGVMFTGGAMVVSKFIPPALGKVNDFLKGSSPATESVAAETSAIEGVGNPKNINVEEVTPPGAKNSVKVYTDGYAQVNKGKVEIYIRGKVKEPPNYSELKDRIKELKKLRNQKPSEFTKEMQIELDLSDKAVHNYERSKGMGKLLDDAGIIDTPENNEMIAKTVLDSARDITSKNTVIRKTINIGSKPIIIESRWIIDKTGAPYCSTIILIEVK